MARLDWSMTIIGYPQHRLSGVPVVGVTHTSAHAALRFAESIGLFTGWLVSDGPSPHLEGIEPGVPVWVALAEVFVENRVACTEGLVSGTISYATSVPADGEPPRDRSLRTWGESRGKPWVQVVDNEVALFGGLDGEALDAVLRWFICRRPIDLDWRETSLEDGLREHLVGHLFANGLTRNLSLVVPGRPPTVDLWAGVHARCPLPIEGCERLSQAQHGLRLGLRGRTWEAEPLDGDCPLDDERARVARPL